MIDVAQDIQSVLSVGSPVLYLDTCALLDLLRDPTRKRFGRDHAAAAMHFLACAEANPPTLTLVLAAQVKTELDDHIDQVQEEGERAIQKLDDTIEAALGVFSSFGLATATTNSSLSQMKFPMAARAIVDRFITAAHIVDHEQTVIDRAWKRVQSGIAPAARGKQSMKDCVIVETYLGTTRALRTDGFGKKILFISTNTSDYTEGVRSQLHSDLVPDFNAVGMEFASAYLPAQYMF